MKSFKIVLSAIFLLFFSFINAIDVNEGSREMLKRVAFLPISNKDQVGGVITISEKNNYKLKENIEYPIVIDADNVSLDLNNFEVTHNIADENVITINSNKKAIFIKNGCINNSAGAGDGSGILINNGASTIYLNDLKIFTCGNGVKLDGIDGSEVEQCKFVSLDLISNTTGIFLKHADENIIQQCNASKCTQAGFAMEYSKVNCFEKCKSLKTFGPATVAGFLSESGSCNLIKDCIIKKTKTSAWELSNKACGILLTGTEEKTKIIDCIINETDMTSTVSAVSYGIFLDFTVLKQIESADHGDPNTTGSEIIRSVEWSPDGNYLAVGGYTANDGTTDYKEIRIFSFNGSSLVEVASADHGDPNATGVEFISSVAWSPYGNYLAVGGQTAYSGTTDYKEIRIFSFDGSSLVEVASADHGDPNTTGTEKIRSVAWSPDGNYLAVGGDTANDGTADYKEIRIFSFNGSSLVEVASAEHGDPNATGTEIIMSVAWSPYGNYLAVGGQTAYSGTADYKEIRIFSFNGSSLIEVASADHGNPNETGPEIIMSVAWSPDGNYLAVGGTTSDSGTNDDKEIRIFSFNGSSLVEVASANHGDPNTIGSETIYSVVWSPNGKYLAVGGITANDETDDYKEIRIFIFNGSSLVEIASADHGDPNATGTEYVFSVSWSPNSRYLAVGGTTANDGTADYKEIRIFSIMIAPTDCFIYGNKVCHTAAYGQFDGTGIASGGVNNYFISNVCCNNEVNFTDNIPNVFYGDHSTIQPFINMSIPTIP